MAGLFNLPSRSTRAGDTIIAQKASRKAKASNPAGITIKGGGGLLERISTINAMVTKNLGKYAEQYETIRDTAKLKQYFDKIIENGIAALDTETNSLDPITCTIAGFSVYTPGMKAVYVPMHHVSYVTGVEVNDQISVEDAKEQFLRLLNAGVKLIFFNAKFDIRVIEHQIGVKLPAYWDCYLGARLLNENEGDGNNGLKALHKKYVLHGQGDAFAFDSLFSGIPFTHIPIKTGYLYAARDAEITYELFEFQRPFLTEEDPVCKERDLQRVAKLFREVEMPVVSVVVDMEDNGICFDFNKAAELSKKYNEQLKIKEQAFYDICSQYKPEIDNYKAKNANHKLSDPISISSPTQLAILLYDILQVGVIDKKNPRGTGEDILKRINLPLCQAILEFREVSKLLSTYVDKMDKMVNPKTGRIHCSFNQIGADTGRFSSSDPNMQNIPSHNAEIRQMFTAAPGYVLLSSDYSAQEPRITAHLCQDPKMIKAYRDGKDLYAEMASLAFGKPYEECREFRPDGTKNLEGKERRNHAKAIFLGICYGKGVPAIGQDLNVSTKKAQQIYDSVLREFPGLKQFMVNSENMARELGYVDTIWGRKRRLPNIQLEPYEFTLTGEATSASFDPLFDEMSFDDMCEEASTEVDEKTKQKYIRLLNRAYSRKEKESVKAKARAEGIVIKDNGGYIAEATRQCVNSRVQGSAADMTKKAMILVGNDPKLKEWGFKLLLPVHDELIGECPEENMAKVAKRFSQLMVEAASDLCVPSKCDVEISRCWYGETIELEEE
jgi:DNA polymerase I-like protein with 3'-5' exonuclease and polymerase domains